MNSTGIRRALALSAAVMMNVDKSFLLASLQHRKILCLFLNAVLNPDNLIFPEVAIYLQEVLLLENQRFM